MIRRLLPALILLAIALAAWFSGLTDVISLHGFARYHAQARQMVASAPALSLAIYIVAFAILNGACLPVALVMTLSSGALFGTLLGGAATMVGATLAATISYFAARSALAPVLLKWSHAEGRLKRLLDRLSNHGFFYVLTTRLMPLPFALVNIACGMAAVPLRTFLAASLIGAVPMSLVYAGLGAGLSESLAQGADIGAMLRSPRVLAPVVALALLSLAPHGWRLLKRRQAE